MANKKTTPTKVHRVAAGHSLTTKRGVKSCVKGPGDEVFIDDFPSKEVFNAWIKKGFIQVADTKVEAPKAEKSSTKEEEAK